MMEPNDNTECIDMLQALFCDHFNIADSEEQNTEELLRECKLGYETMSLLIQTWIRRITLNQSVRNPSESSDCMNTKEELETFHSSNDDEFKLLDVRIRSNARFRSSNIYRPHLRLDSDEEFSSLASSSKPSISPSIDENLFYSENDLFSPNHAYYEQKLNLMHSKNCELESEIAQLKQNLNDLRIQSRNAEELNSQLAIEIEHHQSYNSEWKMRYQELSSKFSSALEDNEQCQKMIIALKSQVQTVMKENEHAKESLKYYQNELKCAEYELAESNERTTDLNRVYGELKEEKKVTQELKEKIWSFEESFKDLKYELSEKEQQNVLLVKEINVKFLAC